MHKLRVAIAPCNFAAKRLISAWFAAWRVEGGEETGGCGHASIMAAREEIAAESGRRVERPEGLCNRVKLHKLRVAIAPCNIAAWFAAWLAAGGEETGGCGHASIMPRAGACRTGR